MRDSHGHGAQLEQPSKVVQIEVVERVFVFPLDFEGNPVLEAVNLVCGAVLTMAVKKDFGLELLFYPAARAKLAVNGF